MPGIVKTISLTLLAIVITLAGLEFGVRVLLPQFDPSGQVRFYADSAERPSLLLPNTRRRQRKNTSCHCSLPGKLTSVSTSHRISMSI